MKLAILALIGLMTVGTVAEAQWGGGYRRPGYGRGGYDRHRGGYGRDRVIVGASCAPEVLEGNVAATDRTLATLASSPEFTSATTFKTTVKEIAAIKSADQRAAAYFDLIGVDASNKDQVVEFIGARDVKGSQVAELEKSAGLSAAQAETVALKLQTALRGGLQ